MLRRRLAAMTMVFAMIITMLAPVQVSAASGDAPLVSSVTTYDYDSDTKKYKKSEQTSFVYNDQGYPTAIKYVYFANDNASSSSMKYKMKKSAPKSATLVSETGRKAEIWTYSKGLRKKIKALANPYAYAKQTASTTYAYKKKFVSKYSYSSTTMYPGEEKYTGGYGYSYKYKMKKGLPTSMTATRLDKNGKAEGYRCYVEYNKYGLVTKVYELYSDGSKTLDRSYTYKIKKGKVVQVIRYSHWNGKKTPTYKYVFKYKSKKVSKQRYSNMINSLVVGTEVSYGTYNWY